MRRSYSIFGTSLLLLLMATAPSLVAAADDDELGGEDDDYEAPPEDDGEWEKPPSHEEPKPPKELAPATVVELDPYHGRKYSAALLLGYGFDYSGSFATNPYTLGIGVRGGYSFPFKLHVGLVAIYHIGSSSQGTTGGGQGVAGTASSASSSYFIIAAEVGYDFWFGPVILRPYLDLGAGFAFNSGQARQSLTGTVGSFHIAPGVTGLYHFNEAWFAGLDMRFNMMTGDGESGFSFSATGGMRF